MIKENQKLLNRINVLSDGVLTFGTLLLAFWLRFYVLPGIITVPLRTYIEFGLAYVVVQLFTYASFGLYQSFRNATLKSELFRLWRACVLDMILLLGWLFLDRGEHTSRGALAIFFVLYVGAHSLKRVILRRTLRRFREKGYNQKQILLIGSGRVAAMYLEEILGNPEYGYQVIGYIATKAGKSFAVPYLGGYEALAHVLERHNPDEVVSAIEMEDYSFTPKIISACETAGVKLAIIPFYADYMPAHPQFDDLNGIPLLNIRRIPLDNFANAFLKRTIDIVGSALLLILCSPAMLVCTIGVKLSSPGPILFRQQRVGRYKKPFRMLKFRSMRVNDTQDSAWSTRQDDRRTKFGTFIRKCSLDELPQFWNVLKGDMSLVGPRPEIPHFVDRFKDEIPLYMVRHQVRPGITGWAQVNGLRGDTPIKERVEYDIYYIENWDFWFDVRILLATVFKGKFMNDEQAAESPGRKESAKKADGADARTDRPKK